MKQNLGRFIASRHLKNRAKIYDWPWEKDHFELRKLNFCLEKAEKPNNYCLDLLRKVDLNEK